MATGMGKGLSFPKDDEDFVFHATDKKGHRVDIRAAIPPEIDQILNQIIARPHYPYRTKADIIRDSLYHRVKWLCENVDGGYGQMLRCVKAIDDILSEEKLRQDFDKQLRQLRSTLGNTDDPERMKLLVNGVAKQVYEMAEGYWKERYLKTLKNEFGYLLEPWSM